MNTNPKAGQRGAHAPLARVLDVKTVKAIGRKAGAALTIVATLLVGLIVMAAPAGAHHPEITGSSYCADDGSISIDYTAVTWSTGMSGYIAESTIGDGAPTDASGNEYMGHVEVSYTPDGGSAVTVDDLVEFVPGDTSASGTITGLAVDDFPVTLLAEDYGRWKNNGSTSGDDYRKTWVVDAPETDCTPPAFDPVATSSWDCTVADITVTLDNGSSEVPVDFAVNGGTPVTVGAGTSTEVSVAGPVEDGDAVSVSVTVNGDEIHTASWGPADCEQPVASSTWECGTDITVTLDNSASGVAVDFVVNGGDVVTVAAGATDTVTLDAPIEDGAPVSVTVTVDGVEIHTDSYEADCETENPVASSAWECGSDITVTLDNSGSNVPVDFVVNGGDVVTVAAGATDTVTLDAPIEDGDAVTVTVTVDGETIHTDTYEANCEQPVASSAWECGSDITVTLDNSASDVAVDFVVNGGDVVTVAAGATDTVTLEGPIEDGDPVSVTVTVNDEAIHTDTYEANCLEPVVTSTWECGTDIVITLDNSGSELAATFELGTMPMDPDLGLAAVAVPAGETVVHTFPSPVEDGDAVTVTVMSDGEEIHGATYGPANCLQPTATSTWDCGLDVVVTLDNTGSALPSEFTVNGGDPITVAGGESTTVTLDAPEEDGDAVTLAVTADGEEILAASHGPANCVLDDEVCGEDETAVDSDDDGTDDSCEPICEDDVDPTDIDGDGVGDECPEVLDNTVSQTVTQAATPVAAGSLAFTGSSTLALAGGAAMFLLLGLGLVLVGKELADS